MTSNMLQIFDIVLRVPPLFMMDSILNQTFLFNWIPENTPVYSVSFLGWILLIIACFLAAVVMFVLPMKPMLDVYSFILSGIVVWFSYWFNRHYVMLELSNENPSYGNPIEIILSNPQRLLVNVMVQTAMAFSYMSFRLDFRSETTWLLRALMKPFRGATYLCMLSPAIWRLCGLPTGALHRVSVTCTLIVVTELVLSLLLQAKSVIAWLKLAYIAGKTLLRTYGIQTLIESQWIRLHVPNVLRVFWITRVAYHVVALVVDKWWILRHDSDVIDEDDGDDVTMLAHLVTYNNTLEMMQAVLVSGCETIIAVMGMTSVIASIAYYIGAAMAAFIDSDTDDDKNMGTVSAILFFILALQTGLTGLDPDKRLLRLGRNFCLLSAAMLHFIHSIVNPILMNLSASQNPSLWKHGRPLAMCAFLTAFPVFFLWYLWSQHTVSTWLLAVTAFNVEVVVKVFISLLLYSLFMIDARREVFWEGLDDYVYYIKSTGNTIEFVFGILVFCNGAWIMLFESGGTIRACMMCIHAYFNIFVQAKEGWKVFIKRRTAVNKINSLPVATEAQIEAHNDVCAICYQDLLSARVTNCYHLFHGVCLRKWLYLQDRCPLCHELIYTPEPDPNIENRNNDEFEQNMNDAMNNRAWNDRNANNANANANRAQNNGVAHAHQE